MNALELARKHANKVYDENGMDAAFHLTLKSGITIKMSIIDVQGVVVYGFAYDTPSSDMTDGNYTFIEIHEIASVRVTF